MSAGALLQGVLSVLRGPAVLNDPGGARSDVRPDGRPPPDCGQDYAAVSWLGLTQQDADPLSLDEVHTVAVTLTHRMGLVPDDRRGRAILAADGLLTRAQQIGRALHHRCYDVLNAANALIPGTAANVAPAGGAETANGFTEPPRLVSIAGPTRVGGDWVGADDGDGDGEVEDVYVVVVTLGGARLITPLDTDT